MKAREAQTYQRTLFMGESFEDTRANTLRARTVMDALLAQWDARRAVIALPTPIESHGPAWVAWRTEQTRLALELSKAEALLIALEDAQ